MMYLRDATVYLFTIGLFAFLLTHKRIFKMNLNVFLLRLLIYIQVIGVCASITTRNTFEKFPAIEMTFIFISVLTMMMLLFDGTISAWRNDPNIPNPPDLFTKILLTICSIGFVGVVIFLTLTANGVI